MKRGKGKGEGGREKRLSDGFLNFPLFSFLLPLLFLSACATPTPQILFPSPGATLTNPIYLEANTTVRWYLGKELLGEGSSWSGNLKPGEHTVRAQAGGEVSMALRVEEDFPIGKIRNIAAGQKTIDLPGGKYKAIWGNTTGQTLRWPGSSDTVASSTSEVMNPSEHDLLRPFEQKLFAKPQRKIPFTLNAQSEYQPGSVREFRLLNLESTGSEVIEAELVWSGVNTLAYVHQAKGVDLSEIGTRVSPIARDFDNRILRRIHAAFGPHADVDNNHKVILLFSPRLNASKFAVGFFYVGDLLANGPDNPDSNQAEVLYLGLPEVGNFNFSSASLAATACHEFQHLVNFSNFSLPYIENPEPPFAPLWLNEGMSHLAEDLCGYNTLGGNLAFVARYLNKAHQTSLSESNLEGQGDTIERRGAGYLFMRYLTELKGGVTVDGAELKGDGGQFLHRLLGQRLGNLTDIAKTAGMEPAEVLWRWWWMLAGVEGSYQNPVLDPSTSDHLGVDLHLGHVQLTDQYGFELDGLKPVEGWPKALPAHAFALRELAGPLHLEIPPGSVQVVRLE